MLASSTPTELTSGFPLADGNEAFFSVSGFSVLVCLARIRVVSTVSAEVRFDASTGGIH